jgi:hypothetical protein
MIKLVQFNPIMWVCVGVIIAGFAGENTLKHWGFDTLMLIIGNVILCAVTLISLYFLKKGMNAPSTAQFLGAVYGSFIIKLVFVAIVVFGYAFTHKGALNKPSLFTLLFLYLVYTFLEIQSLLQIGKKKSSV